MIFKTLGIPRITKSSGGIHQKEPVIEVLRELDGTSNITSCGSIWNIRGRIGNAGSIENIERVESIGTTATKTIEGQKISSDENSHKVNEPQQPSFHMVRKRDRITHRFQT